MPAETLTVGAPGAEAAGPTARPGGSLPSAPPADPTAFNPDAASRLPRWATRVLGSAILRRLLMVPVVGAVVMVAVFAVAHLLPGDPVDQITSSINGITPEEIEAIRSQLGLDVPLATQLRDYVVGIFQGDLGDSFFSGRSVASLIGGALPATIELAVTAALLTAVIGIVTGAIAARAHGTWIDNLIRTGSTIGFSLPWFVVALAAIIIFGVQLGWLPILGRMPNSVGYEPTTGFVLVDAILQNRPEIVWPWIQHLTLPAVTLAVTSAGFLTRVTRAAFLDAQSQPYTRTARMKGLTENAISVSHVMRNASVPVLTVLGLMFGGLLGGAVVTETVFAYPGVGSLLVEAVNRRDYFLLQGTALVIGLIFTLVNAIVDLVMLSIDPRLRRG